MNILKQLQDYKDRNKLINERDTAINVFNEQKIDIQWITWTRWYILIKNHFLWKVNIWYQLLKILNPRKDADEIMRTQEHLRLAEEFLSYLDVRDK